MTSYNRVNGIYAPNSYDLCMKVLRFEWGFDGVVMTDWFSTGKNCGNTALCMAVGNDLIMPGGKSYKKEIVTVEIISIENQTKGIGSLIQDDPNYVKNFEKIKIKKYRCYK